MYDHQGLTIPYIQLETFFVVKILLIIAYAHVK
jgi:hypothetical protein